MSIQNNLAAAFLALSAVASAQAAEVGSQAYHEQGREKIVQAASVTQTPRLDAAIKEMGCKECVVEANAKLAYAIPHQSRILLDPQLEALSDNGLRFLVGHEQGHLRDVAAGKEISARELMLNETVDRFNAFDKGQKERLGYSDAAPMTRERLASLAGNETNLVRLATDVANLTDRARVDEFNEQVIRVMKNSEFSADAFAAKKLEDMGIDPSAAAKEALNGICNEIAACETGGGVTHPSNEERFAAIERAEAFRTLSRDEAVGKHPALAPAYATVAAAQKFAEQNFKPEDRARFVSGVKEVVAGKIEQGQQREAVGRNERSVAVPSQLEMER